MSWDHQITKAVLVTGDSDFVPAIQAAKDAGVLTVRSIDRLTHKLSLIFSAENVHFWFLVMFC